MSTLTLRPNGDNLPLELGTYPASPTDHYSKVDEETKDESDYNVCTVPSKSRALTDIYTFPDHASESGPINSVTIKLYSKYVPIGDGTGNVYANPAVKIGSTVYYSGDQLLGSSVTLYSYTWSLNPGTGSAWSWSDIDNLLAGLQMTGVYNEKSKTVQSYCYQLWVEVDYTEGGGASLPLKNVFGRPFSGVFR